MPSKTLVEHAARGASFTEAMAAARDAVAATETADVLRGEGIEALSGRVLPIGHRGTGGRACAVSDNPTSPAPPPP
ncbi:hypothetical protein [Actinomadura napierensis]|uniref:hypothetical protein n=1 Tax=Actinomadura napierensis TaxID=267854 RepID=UPI0031E13B92